VEGPNANDREMSNADPHPAPAGRKAIERQIVLPLSKAVEIAYKSIRLRLTRSLLVTSGIVLALAFLMSIRTTQAITDAMREWAANADRSPAFIDLQNRRLVLEAGQAGLARQLASAAKLGWYVPREVVRFNPRRELGRDWDDLQREFSSLPAPAADLTRLLTVQSKYLPVMREWVETSRQLKAVREELSSPQQLTALMQQNGVPTTEREIADSRLQTRWLLGLALLVAFVGILNAMLMSVTERFREIGTMKCLGALDSFIVKLFLLESLFQGVVGTVIGVAAGLVLSVASAASAYGQFVRRNPPYEQVLVSAGLCLLVGVGLTVAGAVYPAWQAARMEPIEAMRLET